MLRALLFWAALAVSALTAGDALADKRVALVIGNSTYVNVNALTNPANDATAVAALFEAAGFDVITAKNNLIGVEMRRTFRDFADKARDADIAVVFYAGHGIEVDGVNYLLPVDTSLKRDLDVEDEAVSLDRVVRLLEPAKRLRLIILDACRDNPFTRTVQKTSATRSIGRGLAKVEVVTSDTLIAFAAKAGSTASDGDAKHSPFTTALLKNLTVPGVDLRIALGRVRDDVIASTGHKQEPFVYGSLGGTTVSLVPEPQQVAAPPVPGPVPTDTNSNVRRDYELALQVGTKESWDAFLAAYNTGFYADLARAQRTKLAAADARSNAKITVLPAPTGPIAPPPPAKTPPPAAATAPPPPPPAAKTPPPVTLANTTPTETPETPKATTDVSDTTRLLHAELLRLGCYSGALDVPWGNGGSRRAIDQFNKHAKQHLDVKLASADALGMLRGISNRICPLQCKPGFRPDKDECVKITCRAGFVVGDDGECEREKKSPPPRSASRPEPKRDEPAPRRDRPERAAKSHDDGAPASGPKIVCGQNGCLNVGRGCSSEMRASGQGFQAVVICPGR